MRHLLSVLLIGASMSFGTAFGASVLVAGTVPSVGGAFAVIGSSFEDGAISVEQLFTLSSPAELTTLKINAASVSAQTLEVQLFSGLGLEGKGVLLQTFDFSVPANGGSIVIATIPTLVQSTSIALAAGNYSLLLTHPGSSTNFIYLNLATDANTPDGSLGGDHGSSGNTSPANMVFELDGNLSSVAPEPQPAQLLATTFLGGIGYFLLRRTRE